ncbi:MAG: hypothetical protein RL033_5060 [Pseudomonadota bacterium]|jgi:membrane fusion protein, heavy metal efflux system
MRRLTALSLLALASCRSPAPTHDEAEPAAHAPGADHDHEHADEPAHEELPRHIRLSEEVVRDANIQTAPVRKEVLAITLALPGELAVDPDKNARVASPVAGRLAKVSFQEGSRVKRGDVLATVRVPDLARMRAQHAATRARAHALRSNATRLTELGAKGLAAPQEVLEASSAAEALEVEARALDEQLGLLGSAGPTQGSELALRAPISGVVIARNAVIGQALTTEDTIADIADLSELWFLGRIFEKDLDRVRLGAPAEVALNAFPERRFPGAVEYVSRQIDPVARTVTARIRLANVDDVLRIGLFGTAHVASGTEQPDPVLVTARSAVVELSGKPVVFVRQPDGDFELHELVLGQSNLGRVHVLSGLREGEAVVVTGAFTLKSAVLRGTLAEEGHH